MLSHEQDRHQHHHHHHNNDHDDDHHHCILRRHLGGYSFRSYLPLADTVLPTSSIHVASLILSASSPISSYLLSSTGTPSPSRRPSPSSESIVILMCHIRSWCYCGSSCKQHFNNHSSCFLVFFNPAAVPCECMCIIRSSYSQGCQSCLVVSRHRTLPSCTLDFSSSARWCELVPLSFLLRGKVAALARDL